MPHPATADPCDTATPYRLNPPRVGSPKLLQGVRFAFFRRKAMRSWIRRHGRIFEINVPFFGRSIVVSDPALVRSVCTASADQLSNVRPNLGTGSDPVRYSDLRFDGELQGRDRGRLA
jgi:cytochrome P450